jgi:hypothetical protein
MKIGQLIQKCNLGTQRHADIMVISQSFCFPFREIIVSQKRPDVDVFWNNWQYPKEAWLLCKAGNGGKALLRL